MQTLAAHSDSLDLRLSLEELVAINNALNEVTNALDIEEFETRMGVSRDVAAGTFEADPHGNRVDPSTRSSRRVSSLHSIFLPQERGSLGLLMAETHAGA
jgi:hypothetical protein